MKVLYIEGRPSAHPLHRKFGESINSEFIFVDFILPWHEAKTSRLRRYTSWFLCSIFLPNKNKYDFILSEGAHFPVGLLKWLRLLRKNQKTIALMDNETLYFIDSGFYPERTKKSLIALIHSYDAIISAGKMEADLAKKYSSPNTKVKQIFNGISDVRLNKLLNLKPLLDNFNIVFIGNVGTGWRSWYKGIDLLLESFEIAWQKNNLLSLKLIGAFEVEFCKELMDKCVPKSGSNVEFVGYTENLDFYLKDASLYLHPARGEAWGISVTEAMAAGIMPLVSCFTGSKEVVDKVDSSYIVELNKNLIADKIINHFNLSISDRQIQSIKCKDVAKEYSETSSIDSFKVAFHDLAVELNSV